jgi:phenylpyruvate tautomerase PptA (4-oxalocrotonate tautomerase family)
MPYLQLDTPFSCTIDQKRRLAKRMGEIYSDVMSANINRISIAIRELGEGGLWRCGPEEPRPVAFLMCDIRRGREKEVRAELARQLVAACIEIVGLDVTTINVEFTQHSGDEMYHSMYGGLSDDWQAGQADALDGHA